MLQTKEKLKAQQKLMQNRQLMNFLQFLGRKTVSFMDSIAKSWHVGWIFPFLHEYQNEYAISIKNTNDVNSYHDKKQFEQLEEIFVEIDNEVNSNNDNTANDNDDSVLNLTIDREKTLISKTSKFISDCVIWCKCVAQ